MKPRQTTTLVSARFVYRNYHAENFAIVATLNPATMEVLSLFRGDTIIVRLDRIHLSF